MSMAFPFPNKFDSGRAAFIALLASVLAASSSAQAPTTPRIQPVLVELFTSEGCSDCPPADVLLARLDATQFVPGAHVIVLSEHVTYWDRLGWRDPFSLDSVTARQEKYRQTFGLSDVYTPQMVVDGAEQLVGSDSSALARAVVHAASTPKANLDLENPQWKNGVVDFAVRVPAGAKGSLVAVLAQNAAHSQVVRGENAGRTLHHVAVARVLKDFGEGSADGRALQLPADHSSIGVKIEGPLRLIVFLVNPGNGHVLAVGEQTLNPPA
jgi:hypothetical protein